MSLPEPPPTPPPFVSTLREEFRAEVGRLERLIESKDQVGKQRAGELETAEIHLERRHTEVRGDLQGLKTEVNNLRLGQQRVVEMLEGLTVAHGLAVPP